MKSRPVRLLLIVIAGAVLMSFILGLAGKLVVSSNILPVDLVRSGAMTPSLSSVAAFFQLHSYNDSWEPMMAALHQLEEHPDTSVYQVVFFDRHVKFQYPLASLLPLLALEKLGMSDPGIFQALRIASWMAVWFMAVVLSATGIALLRSLQAPMRPGRLEYIATIAAILLGCIFFYPFIKGYYLGQVQTFLSLGFAVAFYCWMKGKEKTSAVILGAMALFKPQYGLYLIWMLMRRRWGAGLSLLASAAAGTIVSLLVFGWKQNIDYLRVLQAMGRRGESYYPNQSINGVLNRLFFNGSNLLWDGHTYAPFSPAIYAATLIGFAALLGLVLFFPWQANRGTPADFACLGIVATVASPIAWEHHFGILLPIFVWLAFNERTLQNRQGRAVAIVLACVLASNHLNVANLLAGVPVLNILQSGLFISALIAIGLLLTSPPAPAPRIAL